VRESKRRRRERTSTTLPTRYGSILLFLILSVLSLICSRILLRSWFKRIVSLRMTWAWENVSGRARVG